MKKAIIILLTALVALSVFVSCNQDSVDDEFGKYATVTFDSNNGSGETVVQTMLKDTTTALKANEFEWADHIFLCWNTKADGTGNTYTDTQEVKLEESITLYAQWHEVWVITSETRVLVPGIAYKTEGEETTIPERLTIGEGKGSVAIYLTEGTLLTAEKGIAVAEGQILEIYGEGKLIATGETGNAGIGGTGGNSGSILIVGGVIKAEGGVFAAGIGGGDGGNGGVVTVMDGYVSATGGLSGGSGIGGGRSGNGANVSIYGGSVLTFGAEASVTVQAGVGIGAGFGGTSEGTLLIGEGIGLFGFEPSEDVMFLSTPTESYEGNRPTFMQALETEFVTIKFDANTGSGTMADQIVPAEFAIAVNANAFEHESLVFDGWALSDKGEVKYRDKGKIELESDITLYAHWIDAIILDDTYGGKDVADKKLEGGKTYTIVEDLTIAKRLYIDTTESTEPVTLILSKDETLTLSSGLSVLEGQTLVIEGTASLVATGKENDAGIGGGVGAGAGTISISGVNVKATGGSGAVGIGGEAGKDSHGTLMIGSGLGLYGGADEENAEFLSVPTEDYKGDRPVYMETGITPYVTVTFKANYEEGGEKTQLIPVGLKTALEGNTFKYDEHSFTGWATTSTGAMAYEDKAEVELESDLTLYALWVDNPDPLTFAFIEAGAISFANKPDSLKFSRNDGEITDAPASITVEEGDIIRLYATPESVTSVPDDAFKIDCSSDCYVYGNVMSLLYGTEFKDETAVIENAFNYLFNSNSHIKNHEKKTIKLPATTLAANCYAYMFYGCTGLTSAPELPAKTLAKSCYDQMFHGCTGITVAPVLPATTLAENCYYAMFTGCTGLEEAPELPVTTLADSCYAYMFEDCSGLEIAPVLPATTLAKSCYEGMFKSCTSLETAPELPVTTLAESCYRNMFSGCTSLETAPELPATTMASYCYQSMFSGCTGLEAAPELPATTLAANCYMSMFSECTNLKTAPVLSATTMASYCYSDMFNSCSMLEEAPELPATTLASYCYSNMFYGCTGITEAPELPAKTLADYCYMYMFTNCKNLASAPVLPAKTLASGCYYGMFFNCENLGEITCLATDISATNATSKWVNSVKASGSFSKMATSFWQTGENGIPSGWTVVDIVDETVPLTLEFLGPGNLSFTNAPGALKYSKNGGAKQAVTGSISVAKDDKIFLYADRTTASSANLFTINCDVNCYVYGNVMSLISEEGFEDCTAVIANAFNSLFRSNTHIMSHDAKELLLPATTLAESCYDKMFMDCSSLTLAPVLPATELAEACYNHMFFGCSGIAVAPALPATTLTNKCYYNMFHGCTGITVAPELPATTLANDCYYSMFKDCTGLEEAPELPATKLASYCYAYMFESCTGLESAPVLPATKLANSCYSYMFCNCTGLDTAPELPVTNLDIACYASMFYGCTGLESAPVLPATELKDACYSGMFCNCTGLKTAPELPATTMAEYCYMSMFSGCTSLETAPVLPATKLADNCYQDMFNGCTGLTSAPELPVTKLASKCYSQMFFGCTNLETAPELPATTLADYCYKAMFSKCTSLETAPMLEALTLAPHCYEEMFSGCSSLKSITCLATDISAEKSTSKWVENVATGGTFFKNEAMTSWTTGINGIPSGWTEKDYSYETVPLTLEFIEAGTLSFSKATENGLKFAKNGGDITAVTGSIEVVAGDKVALYATRTSGSSADYLQIKCSSDCYVYGNVMSLISEDDFENVTSVFSNAFLKLFDSNTHIKNHSYKKLVLPATELDSSCYREMFYKCSGLTEAPKLPATELAVMCYYNMFGYCTGLTIAPELPATALASYCYQYMFYNCTGLEKAPELPATTLAGGCYQYMFSGCTALTTAPELQAETLIYNCYNNMFSNCSVLNAVTCLATTISEDSSTANWMNGVAAEGTFTKAESMTTWTTGVNGIPSGWTVIDDSEPQ